MNREDTITESKRFYSPAYRINENQSLLLVQVIFLSDQKYDTLAAENDMDPGADLGILMNAGDESMKDSGYSQNVDWNCSQPEALHLQTVPDLLWQAMLMNETSVASPASLSPYSARQNDSGTFEIPIGCMTTERYSTSFYPAVYLPVRAAERYLPFLRGGKNVYGDFSVTLPSQTTESLAIELKKVFAAEDCIVDTAKFGDHHLRRDEIHNELKDSALLTGKKLVTIRDYATFHKSALTFMEQTKQFFFRYLTVTLFLAVWLNIVNVVHMNRLSRRKEYAILSSVGLNARQRMGMILYESFRFTLQTVVGGAVVLILLTWLLINSASDAYMYDNLSSTIEWRTDGWEYGNHAVFRQLWTTAVNLAATLKPYWMLLLLAVLFLFFGYLLTEYLANKRFEKDELIAILKDDMYE